MITPVDLKLESRGLSAVFCASLMEMVKLGSAASYPQFITISLGTIFSPELIAQGQEGGHTAAKMLTETIRLDISTKYHIDDFKLWVYAFYNKRGLVDAIGRAGFSTAKQKFDDFAFGFNQAADRYVMVDVGSGKEAADAKIKGRVFLRWSKHRISFDPGSTFGGQH